MKRTWVYCYMAVLTLLVVGAFFQAGRSVQPDELLPALNGIDEATAEIQRSGTPTTLGDSVRGSLLALQSDVVGGQKGEAAGPLPRLSREMAVALITREEEVIRRSLRVAILASEISARVRLVRERVGTSPSSNRLVAVSVKELLIAFAWPISVGFVLVYLLASERASDRLRQFIGSVKSLKLPGFEFVVGDALKQSAEEAFRISREQVKNDFDTWVQRTDINAALDRILNDVRRWIAENCAGTENYRCTVHVPDLLFADSLYQLTDYVPPGNPRGRAWSVRYGLMGRQWRLAESGQSVEIPPEETVLVKEWGMTREEARRASQGKTSQSMICVVLKPANREPVGMVYLDASVPKAFGDEQKANELMHLIEESCHRHGLIKSLSEIRDALRAKAPLIRIYAT